MQKPQYVYVTYIRTTPEKVWNAISDPKITLQYWGGNRNISDWKPGSAWKHESSEDGTVYVTGQVIESEPPRRLVLSWANPEDDGNPAKTSRLTYEIEPLDAELRLTITQVDLDPEMAKAISGGWPRVLSSLKSFLETGQGLEASSCQRCKTPEPVTS